MLLANPPCKKNHNELKKQKKPSIVQKVIKKLTFGSRKPVVLATKIPCDDIPNLANLAHPQQQPPQNKDQPPYNPITDPPFDVPANVPAKAALEGNAPSSENVFLNLTTTPYIKKVETLRDTIINTIIGDANGQISPEKIKFLIEHIKFKKPEAIAKLLSDILKLDQKERELAMKNKGFGQEAKPPAPILIQINNEPGTKTKTKTKTSNAEIHAATELKIAGKVNDIIESTLPEDEIKVILGSSDGILDEMRDDIKGLSPKEQKQYFADLANQRRFNKVLKANK
jgi:hypothetical protein